MRVETNLGPRLVCDVCGLEITEKYANENGGLIMIGLKHLHWECSDDPPLRDLDLIERTMNMEI